MSGTKEKTKSGSAKIAELLAGMNEEGGYPISILADRHGFLIASAAAENEDPDTQSAVVALVQKTAVQAGDQLGLGQTDEISLYDARGQKLVCRPFVANGYEMILAVLVPRRRQSYRQLTNDMIKAIQSMWRL